MQARPGKAKPTVAFPDNDKNKAGGPTPMQSALMFSLAVSLVLGMWVIWRMTP
jgi:hypothetical protein